MNENKQARISETNQSETVTQRAAEAGTKPVFADHRHASARVRQLAHIMNNSPRGIAQRQIVQMMHQSPRPQQQAVQRQQNKTGLPDQLKSGIETLSGMSMDNVKVHYNSSQPAQLNALAYAQGTDIHVAPGQEKHLPHEAWHVVQQAQGRVRPTMQMKEGIPVNDDTGLEHEADVMGAKALGMVTQRMTQDAPLRSIDAMSGQAQGVPQLTALHHGGSGLVQLYSYNPGGGNTVTITGSAGKVVTFQEATSSSVSYALGEAANHAGGTATTNPTDWSDILKDGGTGHAATQLHLVNADWGGKGGKADGNLFPGSQSLNGHHKTQENLFRNQFTAANSTAPFAMTYTCSTNGRVPDHTFVAPPTGGLAPDLVMTDHTVTVTVTNDTAGTQVFSQNVAAGRGLKLKDPG